MRLIDQLYGDNNAEIPVKHVFEQPKIQKSDMEIAYWSANECLEKSGTKEEFEKAWSTDLMKKFPQGSWRTINGAKVFIHNGKVIAGLGGFNDKIDKFFEGKKGKQEFKYNENSKDLQHHYDYLKQSGIGQKDAEFALAYTGSVKAMQKMSKENLVKQLKRIPGFSDKKSEQLASFIKDDQSKQPEKKEEKSVMDRVREHAKYQEKIDYLIVKPSDLKNKKHSSFRYNDYLQGEKDGKIFKYMNDKSGDKGWMLMQVNDKKSGEILYSSAKETLENIKKEKQQSQDTKETKKDESKIKLKDLKVGKELNMTFKTPDGKERNVRIEKKNDGWYTQYNLDSKTQDNEFKEDQLQKLIDSGKYYQSKQQDKGENKKEEKFSDLNDKFDYYRGLSPKEREKYRTDTVNFVMDLNDRIKNEKSDSVKKIYQHQVEFSDKLMQKINDFERKNNIPILKQNEKDFLEGDWKHGGKRQDIVNLWVDQAKKEVGDKKQFKTQQEAKKEVEKMAKNVEGIDDERYRVLKIVASKL